MLEKFGWVVTFAMLLPVLTTATQAPSWEASAKTVLHRRESRLAGLASGVIIPGVIKTTPVNVSNLPACNSGSAGWYASVSDATAPTYLGVVVGGGSVKAPVFCNGANWVTH